MPVIDIARSTVITVDPDDRLPSIIQQMRDKSVGSVVVVANGEPLGIISDRELAYEVLMSDGDPKETTAREVMDEDLVTVSGGTGIYKLVELMSEHGVRRVPVIENDDLVGIVSLSDVVVLLGMELQHVANAIRTVSPAYEQLATELYD